MCGSQPQSYTEKNDAAEGFERVVREMMKGYFIVEHEDGSTQIVDFREGNQEIPQSVLQEIEERDVGDLSSLGLANEPDES
jgi:hypothetical protein